MTIDFTETPTEDENDVFDFSSPEHVLIHVLLRDDLTTVPGWKKFYIETAIVIWRKNDQVIGAASYEESYSGFLDYTIQDMINFPGEGWFVVENVTGVYFSGDGWTTDDDMNFHHTGVRPATEEEIALA
jgi:hypothetical protein